VTLALLITVLLASALGSAHCLAMCGAFMAMATCAKSPIDDRAEFRIAGRPQPLPSSLALHTFYHSGRLATYLALGTLAGLSGSALDAGASILGFQRAAAILAGVTMILIAAAMLLRSFGAFAFTKRDRQGASNVQSATHPPRRSLALAFRWIIPAQRAVLAWPAPRRAFATGLLTTLLPCGWLYAFVLVAAGTASAPAGLLVMLAFWLGTLPGLVLLGALLHRLATALRIRVPILTSMLLLTFGLLSLVGRLTATPNDLLASAAANSQHLSDQFADQSPAITQAAALLRGDQPECHGN
jgi:sulfite exporter TauE/SafE